jgi:KRAB domain-containing zinc finger protein
MFIFCPQVKVTDFLPKQLCVPCSNKLNICFDFAETCVIAEKKLKRIMKICPWESSLSTSHSYFNYANRDVSERHITDGQLDKLNDGRGDDKVYCCPLCCEGNMILQKGICNAEEIDVTDSSQFSTNGEIVEIFDLAEEAGDIQLQSVESVRDVAIIDTSHNRENASRGVNLSIRDENVEDIALVSSVTFSCRFCGDFCPDLDSSVAHSKYHVNQNGFPCVVCDAYFTKEVDMKNHFKNHNTDMLKRLGKVQVECTEQKNEASIPGDTKLCKCVECGMIFGTVERLSFHTQFHYGARPLVCEQCTKEFTSENMLFRHMNLVHGGTETCKKCGISFMSKVKLDTHVCRLVKCPFKCKICRKQFQDSAMLRKHTASHNFILAKPFQCNECDTSFTHIAKLNMHVEICHSGPPVPQVCFKCNECGAVFPSMEYALLHVEKHNMSNLSENNKNVEEIEAAVLFCCEYCEALFTHVEHLLQHNSEHSGFNSYQCTYCDMLFPDHNEMKCHKKYQIGRAHV